MNIEMQKAAVKTYQRFSKLPLGNIVAKGWLRDQLIRSRDGMGGHMDELEPGMIATPFINYSTFDHVPNMDTSDKTFRSGWSGEISGTYWTGQVQLAFTLNDESMIEKATRWVEGVLAHQEPDGYLGSYPADTDRMADYNPWSANWCYRALLAFYEATGRKEVLDAVYRGLLWFCEAWKDHKTDYAGGTIIESMIIVYAYTGDKRLVQFCEDYLDWLEEHSMWQNSVSRLSSEKLPYNSMHVVAYGEAAKHPALVYCATGDKKLLDASVKGLRKALDKIVQRTGGASSCSEYVSPVGAACETEYCNFATFLHSYSWMGLLTGEAFWADEMERCLFNGAEGARKKDEKAIAYFTSPNQLRATEWSTVYGAQPTMGAYAPCYFIGCCPAQSVRIIPEFVRSMCLTDENNDPYLFCYGPAEITSPKLDFTMDTLYPFRETITLRVTRADNATLHLRVPGWCRQMTATVNGTAVALSAPVDGFVKLETPLQTGDIVELQMPMEIEIIRVNDVDASAKFPIAIERGPLVYAIPIPEAWVPAKGLPITPLPEGWSWYNVVPDVGSGYMELYPIYKKAAWAHAIDEHLDKTRITVTEHEPEGYVWEHPPVTLEVPMYRAEVTYAFSSRRNNEPWGQTLDVTGEEQPVSLVPHGCTTLRITYLPRAKV